MRAVSGFEQAFEDVERAADAAVVSAQGAGLSGEEDAEGGAPRATSAAIKRARSDFDAVLPEVSQAVSGAAGSWPLAEDEELRYLEDEDGYAAELCAVAEVLGLNVYERDGKLISYPSILRILPGDRAVRVDGKRVAAIRPSHLAGLLLKNQSKPARFRSDRFLEAIYTVYAENRARGLVRAARPATGPWFPWPGSTSCSRRCRAPSREYDRDRLRPGPLHSRSRGPPPDAEGAPPSRSRPPPARGGPASSRSSARTARRRVVLRASASPRTGDDGRHPPRRVVAADRRRVPVGVRPRRGRGPSSSR